MPNNTSPIALENWFSKLHGSELRVLLSPTVVCWIGRTTKGPHKSLCLFLHGCWCKVLHLVYRCKGLLDHGVWKLLWQTVKTQQLALTDLTGCSNTTYNSIWSLIILASELEITPGIAFYSRYFPLVFKLAACFLFIRTLSWKPLKQRWSHPLTSFRLWSFSFLRANMGLFGGIWLPTDCSRYNRIVPVNCQKENCKCAPLVALLHSNTVALNVFKNPSQAASGGGVLFWIWISSVNNFMFQMKFWQKHSS